MFSVVRRPNHSEQSEKPRTPPRQVLRFTQNDSSRRIFILAASMLKIIVTATRNHLKICTDLADATDWQNFSARARLSLINFDD